MPTPIPDDPLAEMGEIAYLEPVQPFRVIQEQQVGTSTWFEVEVAGERRWLNGVALLGKEVKVLESAFGRAAREAFA